MSNNNDKMKERQSIEEEEEEDMESSRPTGVVVICIVVGLLGLVSAAAGFGAEATRIKGSEVELVSPTQCAYPQSAAALGMGLTSVASLLLAHIILNLVTGCFCCCCCSSYNNNYIIITKTTSNISSSAIAILCFILSWLTFTAALFLLLTAAVLNERHGEDTKYNGNYYCYIVKPGVFAAGALLSLTSVLLGILFFYYLTAPPPPPPPPFSHPNHLPPAAAAAAAAIGGRSMAVARPPPPPRNHDVTDRPIFVHQDTYMRRQFP